MAQDNNEDQIRKKFMQFQMLQEQLKELSEQLEKIAEQGAELDISINAIKHLETIPVKTELLAPIANGIFLSAILNDNSKLVVNVGSNVTVERTAEEVVALLETQKKELLERLGEGNELLQNMSEKAMKLYKEVEDVVEN